MTKDSFRSWLVNEVTSVLRRPASKPPLLIWCDPDREWLDLLRAASPDSFELWANDGEHELLTRDRFHREPRAPRVVWLACKRDDVTWFKVFELEAESVWERDLLAALRDYGVSIPRDQEAELRPLLAVYAKEWFDRPRQAWEQLTPEKAKGTLVDDQRMLQILAGEAGEFEKLQQEERFSIFARRAVDDFGFPDPNSQTEATWRVEATARLLATEVAQRNPRNPPNEAERIIAPGLARDRALKLLDTWQNHVQFIPAFEQLAPKADMKLGLAHWAKSLQSAPQSYASRAVEQALFEQAASRLARVVDVEELADELKKGRDTFVDRSARFWGRQATDEVGWCWLAQLAEAAALLLDQKDASQTWKAVRDAIAWYVNRGWQLDHAGERLFLESPDFPSSLRNVRETLRRGYLRAVDQIGQAFSELLAHAGDQLFALPTAGEYVLEELNRDKTPTALVILDALRLDLGQRLASLLNNGEPVQRATVRVAVAPVPSITPLGMCFALPMNRAAIKVSLSDESKGFVVAAEGFDNLSLADQRRKWLTKNIAIRDFLNINDVIEGDKLKRPSSTRRIVVVEGREFDVEGHEGQLQLSGADEHLDRYARAIRRLREAGYSRVVVVTDHGFFHWQPEADEVELTKPTGEVLWNSRRAIVGRNLKQGTAIKLQVLQSDLEVAVPRSVNAFKTYGGLGFFHGGATLQEVIIPVIVAAWPAKATKVSVVLKPVEHITTMAPRIQLEPGVAGQGRFFADSSQLARRVLVKVRDPLSGKIVFKADPITIEPASKGATAELKPVESVPSLSHGAILCVEVRDADDEELLAKEDVVLKVDIDEW